MCLMLSPLYLSFLYQTSAVFWMISSKLFLNSENRTSLELPCKLFFQADISVNSCIFHFYSFLLFVNVLYSFLALYLAVHIWLIYLFFVCECNSFLFLYRLFNSHFFIYIPTRVNCPDY